MENQHRKITGYRELSEFEINKMNEIKSLAEFAGSLVDSMSAAPGTQAEDWIPDQRWVSIARTHLQQGFMALTRAVAKPTTF